MPLLISFKSLVGRFSRDDGQREDPRPPGPSPGRAEANVDPVQCPPAPAPPAHVPSITDNHHPENIGSTVPTTAVLVQQPPVGIHNTAASSAVPPEAPIISTTSGVLTSAHHFTIGQLTAFSQNIHSGTTVLQHLNEKAAPIAIHNSSARAYPPRCHPDTRKHLRNDIVLWGMGDGSNGRMFWLLGPAAVGKSAVAQTVAEEFEEAGRLGASFFFSRPNQIDDPDWVIPTLALQLATKHAQYKHILTQYFADNLLIFTKNRRTQFRELIIEPFRILMAKYPHIVGEPLLIILDGLDECKDKQAQCEFIDLISTHVREVKDFPLRWMICSRPEWYLKSTLSDADFHGVCERKEVEVDDPEAREDVKRLLEAGLGKIRKRYKDRLPDGWPPERCLWYITRAASGHLGFVSFILRFIEDEEYDDPDGQFKICVKFLGGGSKVGVINPLHALDLLYRQILSNVPPNRLPTTMHILGLVISRYKQLHSSGNQARFLNLDRTVFYQSLQHLHSVVYVPPTEKSSTTELRIYHASFSDFLIDSNRSGEFYLDPAVVRRDLVFQSLDHLENDDGSPSNEAMIKFSASTVWGLSRFLSNDFLPAFISRLERFNFSCLTRAHTMADADEFEELQFAGFIKWLYSLGNTRNKSVINIVRETSQEYISNVMILEHVSRYPQKYIASFVPSVADPTLPFLLQLRLGKIAQIHIALRVVEHLDDRFTCFRKYLGGIRQQKFKDRLPANWPSDSDLLGITVAAHDNAEVLRFLARFICLIGDPTCGDPGGQLKICTRFLGGGSPGDIVNPLNICDPFYFHILSSVPVGLLPTTMRILGLLIAHPHRHFCYDDQARFLNLDRATFHQSIQRLHPVLWIPSTDECGAAPLGPFDRLFFDFLTDPNRSGKYWLHKEASDYDFVLRCLQWLENDDGSPSDNAVIKSSALFVWITCYKLSDGFIPALISRLEGFDFSRLKQAHIIRTRYALVMGGFGEFLRWLYSLGSIRNKSLISVVQEVSQEEASRPVHNELQAWHWIKSPHDYIASFIPDMGTPELPFTLKLRLGKLSHVYISVEVDDNRRIWDSHVHGLVDMDVPVV